MRRHGHRGTDAGAVRQGRGGSRHTGASKSAVWHRGIADADIQRHQPKHAAYPGMAVLKQECPIAYKAVYMVIGIDFDGNEDALGRWSGEHETPKFWQTVLNVLKNRSFEDMIIGCVDDLTGFSEASRPAIPARKFRSVRCIKSAILFAIILQGYEKTAGESQARLYRAQGGCRLVHPG